MQNKLVTLLIVLILTPLLAQYDNGSSEVGSYERRSITYLNSLVPLDNTVSGLSESRKEFLLDKIKEEIMMSRFDYNEIPTKVAVRVDTEIGRLSQSKKGRSGLYMDQITGVVNSVVVPEIVKYVDAYKELRAQNLRTSQERNSFITDKAKELGITAEQLESVMNSAYIFVPVVSNYSSTTEEQRHRESITVGIVWWKISVSEDGSSAEIIVQEMKNSFAISLVGNSYVGASNYREYAFQSMCENAARSLRTATQEIPEFHLSGQVLERSGNRIRFDLGDNEGLELDQRFRIMELTENSSGEIETKTKGWVVVSEIADSSSENGYSSQARIVSGRPYIGSLLQEYPRSKFELGIGYQKFTMSKDGRSGDAHGGDIFANYNVGPSVGVRHLYLGVGFVFGNGSIDIENELTSAVENEDFGNMLIYGQLTKKFQVRRVLFGVQAGLGLSAVKYSSTLLTEEKEQTLSASTNGLFEIALSPSINIGTRVGMNFSPSDDILTSTDGLGVSVYFTITPRGLSVDPMNLVRAVVGI